MARRIGTANDDLLYGTSHDDLLIGRGGNDTLQGLASDDVLKGGGGEDWLWGGDGCDVLIGGGGDDKMFGGADADLFKGGGGIDLVSYADAIEGVVAYLGANWSGGGAAGDRYTGVENVLGSSHDDSLQNAQGGAAYGGMGNDNLYGGGVEDTREDGGFIRGDDGDDTLWMNYGDTQAWLQREAGADVIEQFVQGQDSFFIQLSEFGLGDFLEGNEVTNSLTPTARGAQAQFVYETDEGYLWLDSNGSDDGGLSLVAELRHSAIGADGLTIHDFAYGVFTT